MNIEEITDEDLREFCEWYVGFHGTKPVSATVLLTCLTGFFHTHSKAADKLIIRLNRLNLVHVKGIEIIISSLLCKLKRGCCDSTPFVCLALIGGIIVLVSVH